jgi:hypothetical protein
MRKTFCFAVALSLAAAALPAAADVLVLPEGSTEPASPVPAVLPQRGQTQDAVLRAFGTPRTQHPPAGGGSPQHPPITRWDYDGYSVFFERRTVIDVVIKDRPKPLHHMDELQPQP